MLVDFLGHVLYVFLVIYIKHFYIEISYINFLY